MIITSVEPTPRRRGRVDVLVDGEPAFEIAREAARTHGLRPGRAVEQPEIDALLAADARKSALDTAVAMLARRPHSEREVRRRLARQKCQPAVADETVAKLKGARLLDDAEYARAWAESRDRTSPRGRRLLVRELRANGVELAVAQEATALLSEEDAAYRVASRAVRSLPDLEYRAFRDRLGARLQRRGFGWDVCVATVDRCWRERSEEIADRPAAESV